MARRRFQVQEPFVLGWNEGDAVILKSPSFPRFYFTLLTVPLSPHSSSCVSAPPTQVASLASDFFHSHESAVISAALTRPRVGALAAASASFGRRTSGQLIPPAPMAPLTDPSVREVREVSIQFPSRTPSIAATSRRSTLDVAVSSDEAVGDRLGGDGIHDSEPIAPPPSLAGTDAQMLYISQVVPSRISSLSWARSESGIVPGGKRALSGGPGSGGGSGSGIIRHSVPGGGRATELTRMMLSR